MVQGFFHIVPDGWALPEPFQCCGEGDQEENGTFFYFPSFCNFSVITKSHIAANFPASVHTGILKGHRNSSMRDVDSSDAPWLALCLSTLSNLPTYQLPAFRIGVQHQALHPLACDGSGREQKQRQVKSPWPRDLCRGRGGNAERVMRLHCRAVTCQPQSIRKSFHPCGVRAWNSAENKQNSPDATCSCCNCSSVIPLTLR